MIIEIEKEDFVRLATYASCADLPEEENKCGMTITRIMDSLDKDVADDVAGIVVVSELVGVASDEVAFFGGEDGADVRSVEAGGGHP